VEEKHINPETETNTQSNNTTNNNNIPTERKIILIQKVNKQRKMRSSNENIITKNYITKNIRSMNKYC
jgi:hypothetical protein